MTSIRRVGSFRLLLLPAAVPFLSILFLILASITPAVAQQPTIGVYFDAEGTASTGTMVSMTPVDIYVFAFNPPPTLFHYDFDLAAMGPILSIVTKESPFLTDPIATDPYPVDLHFNVTLPECVSVGDKVLLGHVALLYFGDASDLYICAMPWGTSPAPEWYTCSGELVSLFPEPVLPVGADIPSGCGVLNQTPPPSYDPQAVPFRVSVKPVIVAPDRDFSQEISSDTITLVGNTREKQSPAETGTSFDVSLVRMHLAWDHSFATFLGLRQGPPSYDWNLNWQMDSTGVAVTIEAGQDFISYYNYPLLYLDLHSGSELGETDVSIDSLYVEYSDGVEDPSSATPGTITVAKKVETESRSWGSLKARFDE